MTLPQLRMRNARLGPLPIALDVTLTATRILLREYFGGL